MTRTYKLRPDVRFRVVAGEAVILLQDSAEVVVLNPVGSRMLELVADGRPVEAVWRTLLEEYDVASDELESDLEAFVARLEAEGVIEGRDNGDAGVRP